MTSGSMKARAAVALALLAAILLPSAAKIGSFFFDTLFMGETAQSLRQSQDKIFAPMMDDLRAWTESPLAKDLASRERDAGPALNRKLEWKGELAGFELDPLATPDGPALMSACEDFPACGLDAFARLNLATNAFDVFAQAMDFDHWNTDANSPVEAVARNRRMTVDVRKPTPDFRRIRGLARAYLLTAAKAKDAAAAQLTAYAQVTQMGKLLLTQQTEEGSAAGLAMLADVRGAYESLPADKRPDFGGALASIDDLRRFERLARVVPGFFGPLTPPAKLESIFSIDRAGAFVCMGAARQFSPENAALLAYAEPTAPGETDYRPYAAVAARAFAPSSPCHLPFEREAWNKREDLRLAELESVRGLPWLRRSYFLMKAAASAAEAAPANPYEAPQSAPAAEPEPVPVPEGPAHDAPAAGPEAV